MRPDGVVVLLPVTKHGTGVDQRAEQRLVQALTPEASAEALNESVLHRLARCDEMPLDAAFLAPAQDRYAGQFRSIVIEDGQWTGSAPLGASLEM